MPRTSWYSIFSKGAPKIVSAAVLRAASITPPVAPKIAPAPVLTPIAGSNSSSGKFAKSMLHCFNKRPISRVVNTISTSWIPSPAASWSSRSISNFFAVQGIILTDTIFLGSIPFFSAYQVFNIAPVICWGDLHVDTFGNRSGK